jgi:predicted transcriptional regulator
VPTATSDSELRRLLDRLAAGDRAARDECLRAASARLNNLARQMLRDDQFNEGLESADQARESVFLYAESLRLGMALRNVTAIKESRGHSSDQGRSRGERCGKAAAGPLAAEGERRSSSRTCSSDRPAWPCS